MRLETSHMPEKEIRGTIEDGRRDFLTPMVKIKPGMIPGIDKNIYVEPFIWTIWWAAKHYLYPVTRFN